MRILLINTTRFGDTLQMQPLIHALRNQGHELAYVCLENYIEVAKILDGLEHAFPIHGAYLLRTISSNDGKNWYKGVHSVEEYAKTIYTHFKPEKIINLIPTPLARLLSLRISKQEKNAQLQAPVVGFALQEEGYKNNTNAWATYMEAVTLNRVSSPYNLSDLFTLLSGESLHALGASNPLIQAIEPALLEEGRKIIRSLPLQNAYENLLTNSVKPLEIENTSTVNTHTGVIALQLGASSEKRQWSIENFAKLSQILSEKGYTPLLVGSKSEERLAEQFYAKGGIAKNAIGKTTILTLASIIKQCSMLISNDTGTMHLAAALDIPIIGIFIATAQAWDTGAVSLDACFVEPNINCHPCNFTAICQNEYTCKKIIPAHIIAEIAIKRLSSKNWQHTFSEHTRIWKSIRDEFGFLSLKPLDILDKNPRYALYMMQRVVYKVLIHKLEKLHFAENTLLNQAITSELDNSFHTPHNNNVVSCEDFSCIELDYVAHSEKVCLHEALSRLLELFFLFSQQGKLVRQMPKMSQAFLLTNERIIATFKSVPYLVPLAYIWGYGMEKYGANLDDFEKFAMVIQKVIEVWFSTIDSNISSK